MSEVIKMKPRGKTQKYTHEEYCNILESVTNGNIVCEEEYITANKPIMHYCKKHDVHFPAKPSKFTRTDHQIGCKKCGAEYNGLNSRKSDEQFKKDLFDVWGDEFIPLEKYTTSNTKMKFLHNIKNGKPHACWTTPNSLLRGEGCGVCTGLQVCVEYNDLNTVYPDLAKNLVNYEDGYTVTPFSGKQIWVKCPNCGHPIKIAVRDYVIRGIPCSKCSDGISYPNKFIYNALFQIKESLDYLEREYTPDWCVFEFKNENRTGRYDVYFEKNGKKYIVEMDGGLGHGKKVRDKNISEEDSLYIDKQKDLLAKQHGITIIRIDCDYKTNNRYEFILNNILNSELANIIDLSAIDFKKCDEVSLKSLVVEACKLWNQGLCLKDIASELHVWATTIVNYLESGNRHGWCENYNKKESRRRSTAVEVFCITTNKYFRAITDGAKEYGIDAGDISKCCRRMATHGGMLNGVPLIWVYHRDYLLMSEEEIANYIPMENGNYTKVVCLNTKQQFDMMKDGAEWGNTDTSSIVACCKGKYKFTGTHPETGEKLTWRYLSDYQKMSEEEIEKAINYERTGRKSVVCLINNYVFNDATLATRWCGLDSKLSIQSVCRGEKEFAGYHPETGEPLRWAYLKNYIKENDESTLVYFDESAF